MIFSAAVMNERVGYANLNQGALWWEKKHSIDRETRAFLNPDIAAKMAEEYHNELNLEWSFGGWMEDRSTIRRGTYLEIKKLWLHTGIDLNARAGTPVFCPVSGTIVYVGTDAPLIGGWGYHVIQLVTFRGKKHALLYAHLATAEVTEGSTLRRNDRIGTIGDKTQNGFWRPHLHLQLFAEIDHVTDWAKFSHDMDGYAKLSERAEWSWICPDPTPLVFA